MTREEEIMNDPSLASYVDKQRGWISEAFMDGVIWADGNRPVDWQQVRIQAAIAAMQGILSNSDYVRSVEHISRNTEEFRERVSTISTEQADALVERLKEE